MDLVLLDGQPTIAIDRKITQWMRQRSAGQQENQRQRKPNQKGCSLGPGHSGLAACQHLCQHGRSSLQLWSGSVVPDDCLALPVKRMMATLLFVENLTKTRIHFTGYLVCRLLDQI